jgi:hypothetical protein
MLRYAENMIISASRSLINNKLSSLLVLVFTSSTTSWTKAKNLHTCESSQSDRKTEALRIRSRNKSGDITKRPSHIIRTALQTMDEQTLQSADIKNVAKAVYRERRKKLPTLPKNRKDVHDVVDEVNTKTNKDESLLLINDRDAEIIIFSAYLNV